MADNKNKKTAATPDTDATATPAPSNAPDKSNDSAATPVKDAQTEHM
jgi:hypothetical protein